MGSRQAAALSTVPPEKEGTTVDAGLTGPKFHHDQKQYSLYFGSEHLCHCLRF